MAAGLQSLFNNIGRLGIGVAVVGGVVSQALYTVDVGHRAVIFDRFSGVKDYVMGEGTHFMIPWVQRPIIYDCRSRPRNIPVVTGSRDMQNVNITLRILFRPIGSSLPKLYMTLGEDYDERVLPSITNEVLKGVTAQFDASELITQREAVSQRVNEELAERAKFFSLILDDISLTHLSFGHEFTNAVEMKQVAQQDAERARFLVEKTHLSFGSEFTSAVEYKQVSQQDAERARFLVEKAEQQKQAAIIAAEGDSKAAELLAVSFSSAGEGLIELRRLEAAEDIAFQMSRSRNVAYLPKGQHTLLNLPMQ